MLCGRVAHVQVELRRCFPQHVRSPGVLPTNIKVSAALCTTCDKQWDCRTPSIKLKIRFVLFYDSYLLTYLLTYLPTYLLTPSLTQSLTDLFTYLLTYLLTYSLTHSLTQSLTYLFTYLLTYSLTHSLTHSLMQSLTYLLSYLFTYLPTPLSRVFLEKLTGWQLVNKFPCFITSQKSTDGIYTVA